MKHSLPEAPKEGETRNKWWQDTDVITNSQIKNYNSGTALEQSVETTTGIYGLHKQINVKKTAFGNKEHTTD